MVADSPQVARPITEFIVIGCGSMGERHTRNLMKHGLKPKAFADPVINFAHEKPYFFNDVTKCIQEQSQDRLVVIASPSYLHAEQAIEAVYSGARALLIEKPVAVNDADAYHLFEVADANNVKVVVGYNFRYHVGIHNLLNSILQPNFWLNAVGIDDITTWPSHKSLGKESYLYTETGGLLWTSGSHAVDIAIFAQGEVGQVLVGQDRHSNALIQRLHHVGGGISILYNKWEEDHPQASTLTYMSPVDAIVVDLIAQQPVDMHEQLIVHALDYFNQDVIDRNLPTLGEAVHGVNVLLAAEESMRKGKPVNV
ncbi:MAG: Gfo/Idh/MocA family protein [Candidatus Thorarchaeota archaeon]